MTTSQQIPITLNEWHLSHLNPWIIDIDIQKKKKQNAPVSSIHFQLSQKLSDRHGVHGKNAGENAITHHVINWVQHHGNASHNI